MNDIEFLWDRKKAQSNRRKHGVAFETACEVFFDPCFIGGDVVGVERREIVIGMTVDWRISASHLHFSKTPDPRRLCTTSHDSGA